ncbi:hypothetical protein KTN05_14410 [Paracoccus sp. Z118]|uniref:hypothetical protein n=1 Tax=Paracoccus sp. Z118 TaxID=2851017 RepID=UPI001C2C4FC8|nr:hypothetical protein [Paracoccus sp. Z118]MBV0893026.1 hypothetical protein [Paracoccus sp. Z118]
MDTIDHSLTVAERSRRTDTIAAGGADMQRFKRFIETCCKKLDLSFPDDPSFAERIAFSQKAGLGRSLAFAKATIRRALINRQPTVSFEDARRIWLLNGGSDGEPTPFDPGDWPEQRKLLESRGW